MTTEEKQKALLADVLNFAHLTKAPAKMSQKTALWVEAIAKIRKADYSTAYAVLKRKPDLSYRIVYCNGNPTGIAEILEIRPTMILNQQYIKTFKDNEPKSRIHYLHSLHIKQIEDMDLDNMEIDDLNRLVVEAAMYQQLKALEE